MSRVAITAETLELLLKAEKELKVPYRAIFDYVLRNYTYVLTEDNADYAKSDGLSANKLRRINVSSDVIPILRDMSVNFSLPQYAVCEFLVKNTVASFLYAPNSFPDLAVLAKYSKKRKTNTATAPVSISLRAYEWLSKRKDLHADGVDEEHRISLPMMIEAMYNAWPPYTIERLLFIDDVENSEEILEKIIAIDMTGAHSIRVPIGLYNAVRTCAKAQGVTMGRVLSFLIIEELESTQQEITMNGGMLPTDVRERYARLLRNQLDAALAPHAGGKDNS
jgi:hypothetical protein